MSSSYPAALDNLPADYVGTDQADVVDHAGMHNDERDAINAVQAELGTDPSGAAATVRARLDAIDADPRWTDSRTPTGPGSPAGVRIAARGAFWVQNDHPVAIGGILVWYKTSDIGAAGWVPIAGDTGLLRLSSWDTAGVVSGLPLASGWAPRAGVGGALEIRRNGAMVTVVLSQVTATASSPTRVFDPIAGFAPAALVMAQTAPAAAASFVVSSSGLFVRAGGTAITIGTNVFFASCVYPATDVWPASASPV